MWPGFQSQRQRHISLLLALSFASRGFFPGTPVFPSPQKTFFCSNSNSIWNTQTRFHEVFFCSFFFRACVNRENRDAFYPHRACQVDKGWLPCHFSFRISVIGSLNMKESGCTLYKPLTINRILGIGKACRDCGTGKISDGITGFQKPYWGWGLHIKVALEQK